MDIGRSSTTTLKNVPITPYSQQGISLDPNKLDGPSFKFFSLI